MNDFRGFFKNNKKKALAFAIITAFTATGVYGCVKEHQNEYDEDEDDTNGGTGSTGTSHYYGGRSRWHIFGGGSSSSSSSISESNSSSNNKSSVSKSSGSKSSGYSGSKGGSASS